MAYSYYGRVSCYLDEATNKAISFKSLRFDDKAIRGKTVAAAVYGYEAAAVSFTDGTWAAVGAEVGHEGYAEVVHESHLDLHDLRSLGLISDEQFCEAKQKQEAQERARKEERIKRLQAELNKP